MSADWQPATGADLRWCHQRLSTACRGPEGPEREPVRAMPVVVRLEKADPPARTAVLEAAAGAVLRLCLDARVAPGGPWHEQYALWTDARMRKISRRARGGPWERAREVNGVGAGVDGAAARAIVPAVVDEVDPRIARLQIGGTDLPVDEPGPPPAGVPVLWIDAGLRTTMGKDVAQVGHAVMLLAAAMTPDRLDRWLAADLTLAVRRADRRTWDELVAEADAPGVAVVRDAGFTEVAPGARTVIAVDSERPA